MSNTEIENKGYNTIKEKMGIKYATKYFNNIDRIIKEKEINRDNIVEYMVGGLVIKENEKYLFYALFNMNLKKWDMSNRPFNVTESYIST